MLSTVRLLYHHQMVEAQPFLSLAAQQVVQRIGQLPGVVTISWDTKLSPESLGFTTDSIGAWIEIEVRLELASEVEDFITSSESWEPLRDLYTRLYVQDPAQQTWQSLPDRHGYLEEAGFQGYVLEGFGLIGDR